MNWMVSVWPTNDPDYVLEYIVIAENADQAIQKLMQTYPEFGSADMSAVKEEAYKPKPYHTPSEEYLRSIAERPKPKPYQMPSDIDPIW